MSPCTARATAAAAVLFSTLSLNPARADTPSEAAPLGQRAAPLISTATLGTLGLMGVTAAITLGVTAVAVAAAPLTLPQPIPQIGATLRSPPIIVAVATGALVLGSAGAVLLIIGGGSGVRAWNHFSTGTPETLAQAPEQKAAEAQKGKDSRTARTTKALGHKRNPRSDM